MQEEISTKDKFKTVSSLINVYKLNNLKRHTDFALLLVTFVSFTLGWLVIVLGKFYSLHSYVFDLGFIMQRLWQPYHVLSLNFDIYILFSSGFQFVLSPLYFLHNFQAILILQVVSIEISCFPLYSIAKNKLNSTKFALIISVAYLVYFPSSGILWFDVHFQAFFVPLFIFAYYLYTNGHYKWAVVVFVLSGTTRFPYMIFAFLFSIFELLEYHLSGEQKLILPARVKSILVLLIVSFIFLIGGAYYDVLSSHTSIIFSSTVPFLDRLPPMALTILFLLGPLFFLPLFKIKWLVMSIPLFALGLYSGNVNYTYPLIMRLQYSSMIVPIAFLGTIEVLASSKDSPENFYKSKRNANLIKLLHLFDRTKTKLVKKRKKILISILCLLFVGSLFYQPYSPLNTESNLNYNFINNLNFNSSNYNTLMSIIHLIPPNNPYVLFQNDMPELLPRPGIDNLTFLFTVYLSNNVTLGDVLNNTFPIISTSGGTQYSKVDYLLAYTQSSQYYLQFDGKESTLPQLLSLMLQSSKYGIVAEEKGFILVERNYSGAPKMYEPLILTKSFTTSNEGGTTFHDLSSYEKSSTSIALVPGNYSVTFYISVTNNSKNAYICGSLGYSFGSTLSNEFNVSASYFHSLNSQTAVTLNISVPNEESNTVFIISASNFVGNLTIYKVSLVQTSY